MSKQRWKLLLCAIAAAATLVTALFVSAWFHMDVMGSEMEIDLRSASMCGANGVCVAVPLSKFRGFYSIMGNAAFFAAIPVLILVVVQCASRLVTGAASSAVTKAGYGLGMVALITGFGAGYLFAPQSAGIDDIAVITVTRTWAPLIFVVGNLLALFAMYLASSEWLDDDVGEYKPIKLDGGRLPVTPLSVNRIHTPQGSQPLQRIPTPQGSQPLQRPGSDGGRSRTPTGQQRAGSEGGRSRTPTGQQHAVSESGRSRTPTGQQRAMTESGRSRTPTGQQLSEDVARRLTPSEPIVRIADPSRRLTPSQQTQRVDDPARRFTPSQQIQRVDDPTRRLTPSQQTQRLDDPTRRLTPSGQIPRIDDPSRPKSPSQPPAIARTSSPSGLRSRTPSQQPLGIVEVDARAKSPSQQPVLARTTSPSGIAIDPASRARTSSSGPIDLAARLSATAPQGVLEPLGGSAGDAPIEFSIRPPLPQPEPVPPDQIPVDPAAGLTIRKRPASVAPPPLAPPLAAAPAIAASPHDEVPLSKAKTVDLPDSAFQPPIAIETPPESGLLIRKKSPTGAPHAPLSASMPAIALDGIEGLAELKDELSKPHAASPASPASPASSIEEALIANADATAAAAIATAAATAAAPTPAAASAPLAPKPAASVEPDPVFPPYIQNKIKYAIVSADISPSGITGKREDGTIKHVVWEAIVGVIARRMPPEKPFEGATIIDVVSSAGSTLRVAPWTKLRGGLPLANDAVERARGFVNLVAAQALGAKLDPATKLFAAGPGQAAQLPTVATLATHDDRLA